MTSPQTPTEIAPAIPPDYQYDSPQSPYLIEVNRFVRANEARQRFQVSGAGRCAAVLDTGLNTRHVDFAGRIAATRNFTADNGGDPGDVRDSNGHGTHVAGIVAAGRDHTGLAPGARLAALKALPSVGPGSFVAIDRALGWVLEQHAALGISAVCMSLGDAQNYTSDTPPSAM